MRRIVLFVSILGFALTPVTFAESADARIAALEAALKGVFAQLAEKEARIKALESQLGAASPHEVHQHSAECAHGAPAPHTDHAFLPEAVDQVRVGAFINLAAGGSSEPNEVIDDVLQTGAHDPKERGFTLQELELWLDGHWGPFDGEAHIVFLEDAVELEEAFGVWNGDGLKLKAGYFLSGFGLANVKHLHNQTWLDRPIIANRLFGGEGTRANGVQLSLDAPASSTLAFSIQNAHGDFTPSFRGEPGAHHHGEEDHGEEEEEHLPESYGEEGIGGRPFHDSDASSMDDLLYTLRWSTDFALNEDATLALGLSGMYGSNGSSEDGHTAIYGADLTLASTEDVGDKARWKWTTEFMHRNYDSDAFSYFDDSNQSDIIDIDLPEATLEDWGLYSQALFAVKEDWQVGLRYEFVSGSGDSAEEGELYDRNEDATRGDRTRISPLLQYQASDKALLRLQYNYDDADFLPEGDAHSVWLGFQLMLGQEHVH